MLVGLRSKIYRLNVLGADPLIIIPECTHIRRPGQYLHITFR
jgi:hypothetical protein